MCWWSLVVIGGQSLAAVPSQRSTGRPVRLSVQPCPSCRLPSQHFKTPIKKKTAKQGEPGQAVVMFDELV